MRVKRMDVIVVELFLLWISKGAWREFPQALGLWRRAAGLLVGLVWGGGIPEFQPGWSGIATPPHLAPRQCTGSNQQDAPWQAYLIKGVAAGRVGGIVKDRVWEKELKKTRNVFLESQSHVCCTIVYPDYNYRRLWILFIILKTTASLYCLIKACLNVLDCGTCLFYSQKAERC